MLDTWSIPGGMIQLSRVTVLVKFFDLSWNWPFFNGVLFSSLSIMISLNEGTMPYCGTAECMAESWRCCWNECAGNSGMRVQGHPISALISAWEGKSQVTCWSRGAGEGIGRCWVKSPSFKPHATCWFFKTPAFREFVDRHYSFSVQGCPSGGRHGTVSTHTRTCLFGVTHFKANPGGVSKGEWSWVKGVLSLSCVTTLNPGLACWKRCISGGMILVSKQVSPCPPTCSSWVLRMFISCLPKAML